MEKNPIVQSMLPTMSGPEKRKGPSSVTMRTAMTVANNTGALLRASDYTPPAGFVETMERPSPYAKSKNTVSFTDNVLDELWKIN